MNSEIGIVLAIIALISFVLFLIFIQKFKLEHDMKWRKFILLTAAIAISSGLLSLAFIL